MCYIIVKRHCTLQKVGREPSPEVGNGVLNLEADVAPVDSGHQVSYSRSVICTIMSETGVYKNIYWNNFKTDANII